MKSNKFISAILSCTMIVSLATGCGASNTSNETASSGTTFFPIGEELDMR